MRKSLVFILMFFALMPVFSNQFLDEFDTQFYRPTSSTFRAMGSSGRAISLSEDVAFVNAANNNENFRLILPSLEVGLTNINDLLSTAKSVVDKDVNKMLDALSILSGSSYLASVKLSGMMIIKDFSIQGDLRLGLYTMGESISASISIPMETILSIGYSHRFEFENDYSLSIGGNAHLNYREYSIPIDASSFVDYYVNNEELIKGRITGSNISFDLGATFNLPYGFASSITIEEIAFDIKYKDTNNMAEKRVSIPSSLCLSLGYKDKFGPFTFMGAIDLVDVLKINSNNFFYHLNLGAGIEIWKNIGIYGGLKGGYPSFGLKLKLFFFELFASYEINDCSKYVGYTPKDTLSLMIRFFF